VPAPRPPIQWKTAEEDGRDPGDGVADRRRNSGGRSTSVGEALANAGICAWDGNYYALELMERLGIEATGGALRLGLAHYNTTEEIDRCVAVLNEVART